jgi:hypothetical protein
MVIKQSGYNERRHAPKARKRARARSGFLVKQNNKTRRKISL